MKIMTRQQAKAAGIEIPESFEYQCGPHQPAPYTIVSKRLAPGGASAGNGYFVQDYAWNCFQIDLFQSSPSAIAIAPEGVCRSDIRKHFQGRYE